MVKDELLKRQDHQIHKTSEKVTILTSTKEKTLIDNRNYNELVEKLTGDLNRETLKNAQLAQKNIQLEEQIKNCDQMNYELKAKLAQTEEQATSLTKIIQENSLKQQVLERQKSIKTGELDDKQLAIEEQK